MKVRRNLEPLTPVFKCLLLSDILKPGKLAQAIAKAINDGIWKNVESKLD